MDDGTVRILHGHPNTNLLRATPMSTNGIPHTMDYGDFAAEVFASETMEKLLRHRIHCLKAACESYKEVMELIAQSLEANPQDAASVRMANERIWTEFVERAGV